MSKYSLTQINSKLFGENGGQNGPRFNIRTKKMM